MCEKLKVEMFRYGTLVFGKVLEMDEGIRGIGILDKIYQDGEEFKLSSLNAPELTENELFVRGDTEELDNKVFRYNYPNEEKASIACRAFKRLVDKVNAAEEDSLLGSTGIKRILP